jgi:nucleotide-binding universal stress UspA family protein
MITILIALDFSTYSPEVEKKGFELATSLGASVTLVTIVNKYRDYARPDTGAVISDPWEARQLVINENLKKVKEAHPDVDTKIITYIGDPKTGIVEAATQLQPALIVMGTHGRTGLPHLLLGSTAEYVVRHSPIPVVVIPYKTIVH